MVSDSEEQDDNVIHVDFGGASSDRGELREVSEPAPSNVEKLNVFSELVDKGTVLVTLDTRVDGVVVPHEFSGQPRLNLSFCHLFRIPDFDFDDHGVRASLSFGGVDFFCDVPWESVYMMRSHVQNEVLLFPDDLPEELTFIAAPPDVDTPTGEDDDEE